MPSGARRSSDRCSPADVALVWTTRSRPSAASAGSAKSTPSAVRDDRAARVDVDQRDLHRREPAQQSCDTAADHPGADDGHPIAEQRCSVPQRVDRGLDGAREHRASRGNVLGHHGHGSGRHHVGGLVREEAEDRAAAQPGGPLFDGADVEVAVLDRPREVALLERSPHRGVLTWRHTAAEHERLGAAADAGPQRAHHHVVSSGRGQRDRSDLPDAGRAQPERACLVVHGAHLGRSSARGVPETTLHKIRRAGAPGFIRRSKPVG